jgi:hypothetical protein
MSLKEGAMVFKFYRVFSSGDMLAQIGGIFEAVFFMG